METMGLILLTLLLFGAAEYCTFIPVFVARKLTHLLSGVLILNSDVSDSSTRTFVLIFSAAVPIANYIMKPLRFTKSRDLGIPLFGGVVFVWAYYSLPFIFLAPLFIADPIAALVGQHIPSRVWFHNNKTIAGSLAFFATTVLLLSSYESSAPMILLVAYATTVTEALGGAWDNLLIALPLYAHYCMSD